MDIIKIIRAEIERRYNKHKYSTAITEMVYAEEDEQILSFLDTLEEPEKRSYKDCNGCKYNRTLKDQIGWQFQGCFGGGNKGKPIAEIVYCPLKVVAPQEQEPEVDLEKEIDKTVYECTDGYNFDWDKFARHFYNLGKNAK